MKRSFNIYATGISSLIMGLLFASHFAAAQQFYRTGQMTIDPAQVIIENYFTVSLPGAKADRTGGDQFDRRNLYTGIFLIADERKKNYHILYQTDFLGRLSFLAISNNLLAVFNKKEKPMVPFNKCIAGVSEYYAAIQVTEAVVKCILERLSFCSR